MKQWQIWDYPVEVDWTATKEWYEQSEGWSCECGDCQNFLALAKNGLLPSAVTEIVLSLGILPEKPTYVCELPPPMLDTSTNSVTVLQELWQTTLVQTIPSVLTGVPAVVGMTAIHTALPISRSPILT